MTEHGLVCHICGAPMESVADLQAHMDREHK